MREIKCRSWDKVKEEYLYSDTFPSMWQFFKELENRGIRHFETEWFTGLKDKNGVEIYEGDIVFDGEYTWEVKWLGCAFWLTSGDIVQVGLDAKPLLIIGNIYENPELLK